MRKFPIQKVEMRIEREYISKVSVELMPEMVRAVDACRDGGSYRRGSKLRSVVDGGSPKHNE
jgi:hypothetical protein